MYGKRQVSRLLWTVARSLRVREPGERNHRAVVGTQVRRREKQLAAPCRNVTLQARSKLRVCAHTARDDERIQTGLVESTQRFDGQHINDRFNEGAGDVSARLFAHVAGSRTIDGSQHGGLKTAKAKFRSAVPIMGRGSLI